VAVWKQAKSDLNEPLVVMNLVLKFICDRIMIEANLGKFRNAGALCLGK
jgi:hypothetical protein